MFLDQVLELNSLITRPDVQLFVLGELKHFRDRMSQTELTVADHSLDRLVRVTEILFHVSLLLDCEALFVRLDWIFSRSHPLPIFG